MRSRLAAVLPIAALALAFAGAAGSQTLRDGLGDPAPQVTSHQWVLELRFDRGEVYLVGVTPLELPRPEKSGRAMGRFAVELFEGPVLLERVRFDFPLLAPMPTYDAGPPAPDLRGEHGKSRIGVRFPAVAKGNRLELVDRASGRRWALPWPLRAQPVDAGAP